ncbi:MAG: LON peptidase substrate-binding domain-containing protein [Chthoniobacteraceae bacterium]
MIRHSLAIPTEAPVMVLPGAVLFPHSLLPLRIFEPRYRAMLEWALEHDHMFCVAQMKPGIADAETDDQFFHVAGIGLISASVTQADGTSNLMLQGLERVRFHRFRQSAPFRIAEIEPLPGIISDPEKAATLASTIRKQCSAIRVNDTPLPESFSEALRRITEADVLADTVAQSLVTDAMARQALLEEEDATARLRKLSRILREPFLLG